MSFMIARDGGGGGAVCSTIGLGLVLVVPDVELLLMSKSSERDQYEGR
jgi:hypothetical protein